MTRVVACALALLVAAGPAAAGPLSDLIFAPGAAAASAAEVSYAHERRVPADLPEDAALPKPVSDEVLTLAQTSGEVPRRVLTRQGPGTPGPAPVSEFPLAGPDPVLLFFLESTARNMAALTGGSPFYIRNRIREALGQADLGTEVTLGDTPARQIVLQPFAADPNRASMGAFAELALTLVVETEGAPRFLSLSADTAAAKGGYHESLTLMPEEE
ncbi:hypothetical protein GVY41_05040 [Frigidibacter albus]|uniref:GerMN domain-containing protein n=1 Tax=Frigidibacter albus TaxID=1465486 RepID=A0A6L8VGH1_9RHOB|nr:hypothetical protein [Frigidibacter albus]MZQ88821.1 hypothetical protein [Frigidibacter albus]NBE30370.1 hypothetical protein [Frigidibacter albus]GGH50685.1 hypothetical protein GCM10011341_13850 [Frigidibacter albus]